MVFQGAKNSTKATGSDTDFKDLEMVKAAEESAIHSIENASRRAEKIVVKAKQDIIKNEEQAIAQLTAKLEKEYKIKEEKAKREAKMIKAKGDEEANRLKQEVMSRVPNAVEYVVKIVISD